MPRERGKSPTCSHFPLHLRHDDQGDEQTLKGQFRRALTEARVDRVEHLGRHFRMAKDDLAQFFLAHVVAGAPCLLEAVQFRRGN